MNGQPAEALAFTYDDVSNGNLGKGLLTGFRDSSGNTKFKYDEYGRQVEKAQTVGTGTPKILTTSYQPNGQIEGHVFPSGAEIRYTYRADGRVLTIAVNGVVVVREIEYHPMGPVKSWRYGAGTERYERQFDRDGRIQEHTAGAAARTIGFDAASRITAISDGTTSQNRWTYGYDNLDRLNSAQNAATAGPIANLNLAWTYDPTGNRRSETRNQTPVVPYAIEPSSNRLAQVGTLARTYDAVGNTLNNGEGLTSTYNARNRLVQTSKPGVSANFAHTAMGERVCKSTSGTNCASSPSRTEYIYDSEGHLIGEYAQSIADQTETIWLDDTPIAVLKRRPGSTNGGPGGGGSPTPWSGTVADGTEVLYIQPDHLDSPRVLVNAQSQSVWRWDSAPFGDTDANEQPTAGISSLTFNLRFPGQQYDGESGKHHNYFRDYEAHAGRYLQSDPLGLEGASYETYTYVGSSPVSYFDSNGLAKRGPKTKNEGGAHNEKIQELSDCIVGRGGSIKAGGNRAPEREVKTPGGKKKTRRPDIIYTEPDSDVNLAINVGWTKPRGLIPLDRESDALRDLTQFGGLPTSFSSCGCITDQRKTHRSNRAKKK